jgi:predicted Zn-dependent peptidase
MILSLFTLAGLLLAAEDKQNMIQLPKGVSIHQLDNGLQVLLIENPALPMIGVNVVVKTGSAYENFSSSGMSHMLEHLLFNGTTSRTQKELYDAVDKIGGYNNANTSQYYTNYMMVTPAERFVKGMEIQADMLFNSTIPEEKFKKEKGIVLEEIAKSLANASEQIERNQSAVLYDGHAVSLPVLGTYSTIKHMDRDDVYEFYKNYYVPNNMIMSVIGNFKTANILKHIQKIYGAHKPGSVHHPNAKNWATGFDKIPVAPTGTYYRFHNGKDYQLQLFIPLNHLAGAEYYELIDLFFDKNLERFQAPLKNKFGDKFKSVQLSSIANPAQSFLKITVHFKDKVNFSAAKTLTLTQLTSMKIQLSNIAINNKMNKARTAFLKNIEKPHMFGIYNANKFAIGGVEAVLSSYGGTAYLAAHKALRNISFTNALPVTILQSPMQADNPKAAATASNKEYIPAFGAAADLIMVQNSANNLAAIHLLIKHKAPLEAKYGKDAAKILHDIFGEHLKNEKKQKISNQFGLTATVNDNPWIPMDNIYLHDDFGYIRFEGLADDMETLTAFIQRQLLEFTPSETDFNKASAKMNRGMGGMMMGGNKAKSIFENAYKAKIFEENPHKDKPKLTYENLLAFKKEYFTPANMIVAMVSPAKLTEQKKYFENFKGGEKLAFSAYEQPFRLPLKSEIVELNGGGEQSYLFYGFIKKIAKNDKAALKALSLLLSDKISFDIREKQGMAYRMNAGIVINNDKALFRLKMGTRPENVAKLRPQLKSLFSKTYMKDISRVELEKSIHMYLGRMMFRRLASINRAYYLSNSLYFHNDIQYDSKSLNDLKNISLEDVKSVIEKYLTPENVQEIIVR